MLSDLRKTPWPYFGGKADAAPAVWAALGDPDHYVEPFMGSLAVLLRRPALSNRPYFSETVNDADGLLCNAWRAIQLSPDATADAASWPVCEADLHARHLALVRWRAEHDLEHLMGDPGWHDPVMAGWWLWGTSCWIGSGWCSGRGPWVVGADGRIERRAKSGTGVARKLPNIGEDGRGVNVASAREPGVKRERPQLTDGGRGVNTQTAREPGVEDEEREYHPMTMPEIRRWFAFLTARLRHVRILNGDWARLVTNGALKTLSVRQSGHCGVFLDPPYADTAGRDSDLYASDDEQIAHAVRDWAVAHGGDPQLRIVLAGFEGEHEMPDTWHVVEWYRAGWLKGGMAHLGGEGQQKRERLWLSPACLDAPAQLDLVSSDQGDNHV